MKKLSSSILDKIPALIGLVIVLLLPVSLLSYVILTITHFSILISYLLAFILYIVLYTLGSTRIVTQGTEAIVERLGRYHRKLKPGLNFVVPFIDKIVFEETVREQILDVPPEIVITKDNVLLDVDLVLYWRVEDLVRTYYSVEDFEVALANAVITKFRQNAAQLDSEEIALTLSNIGDLLLSEVNKSAETWGVKVTNLDLNVSRQDKSNIVANKMQVNHDQLNEKLLASNTISIDLPGEINWIAYQRVVEDLSKKGLQIITQDWRTLESGDKVNKSLVKIKYLPVSLERDEVYSAFVINYGTRRIELDSNRFERQKYLDVEDEFKEDIKSMFQQIQAQMQTLILSSSREIKNEIYLQNNPVARSISMKSDQSQNFKIGQDFIVNATDSVVSLRDTSGAVTKTINQLPSSLGSPGIKELLTQLQNSIEAEPELPDEDKAEALEQVKTLAKAGQKPEDNALQIAAKTSIKILKGTVASLPDAAKLTEACAKLLPAITSLLALV